MFQTKKIRVEFQPSYSTLLNAHPLKFIHGLFSFHFNLEMHPNLATSRDKRYLTSTENMMQNIILTLSENSWFSATSNSSNVKRCPSQTSLKEL